MEHMRQPFVLASLLLAALACGLPGGLTPGGEATLTPVALGVVTVLPGEVPPATPTLASLPPVLRVAFLNQGNVWMWTEQGGAMAQLSTVGSVSGVRLSDDAQVVAFERNLNFTAYELWAVNADGSNERLLVSSEELDALRTNVDALGVEFHQFAFVPGTHQIAYTTRQFFDGPGAVFNGELQLVDADTGNKQAILPPDSTVNFAFSPDGRQIALITGTGLSLVNADGTNRRDALTFGPIPVSEGLYIPEPVWAADSSGMGVTVPPTEVFIEPPEPTNTWLLPADGSPARQLGSVEAIPLYGPVFSPDLSRVAYFRRAGDSEGKVWELHIANADGSDDALYDTGPVLEFLGWSPDGTRFVYSADDGMARLGQVGAGPQPLSGVQVQRGLRHPLRWVDGGRFLYLSSGPSLDTWELRLAMLDGSSVAVSSMGEVYIPDYDFAD